jgi:alkyl sulfatase BDS1-like metallo-beta-lactamase superfamily hydrolase
MKAERLTLSSVALFALLGCGGPTPLNAAGDYRDGTSWSLDAYQGKPATQATAAAQRAAEKGLPVGAFLDGSMIREHSKEILIATLPPGVGALDVASFAFVEGDRPEPIHPSIYAYMRETYKESGLFKLGEGIYQIRGDLAHITLLRGKTGWIVPDAGATRESAAGAWKFAHELLPGGGDLPISTVIYSHSHVDHFGGVEGLISEPDAAEGRVEVIAPYGFMQEALRRM